MRLRSVALLWCGLIAAGGLARAREFTLMIYNVENLVAATGKSNSPDYAPVRYSRTHLMTKLNNIAKVLLQVDKGKGPDIVLLQEIERDFTTEQYTFDHTGMLRSYLDTSIEQMLGSEYDITVSRLPVEALLIKTLWDRGLTDYRVAAADDMPVKDARRQVTYLNVVFSRFPIGAIRTYPIPGAPAILEVQLDVDGYPLYLFNNEWKEGIENQKAERLRIKAAEILRERIDEILAVNPNTDIVIGGDFNCLYDQKQHFHWSESAMEDVLRVQGDKLSLRGKNDLYNLWYELPAEQRASEVYRGVWTTCMQMIVSRGLFDFRGIQYIDGSFSVGAYPGLNMKENGEPFAWSFRGLGEGYSTHFPLVARFKTVPNNRTDVYLKLPSERTAK